MQVYTNSKKASIKTFLFLLLVGFIAYLPVSSFLFFLKNDAFNGYFPPKFFMSESLHSGYLPLWNPYINFGLPQYGDLSSGFWSPVTWLIASTVGYNAYTFTIELLCYIFLSGAGMYLLCRFYKMDKWLAFTAGIAYMCCGYMVGHLQHFNWISGAAFLPWCIWSYHLLQNKFSLKNILATSLLLYLLAASAHPGITIGALYFFAGFALFGFLYHPKETSLSKRILQFTKTNAVLLIATGLLALGMIAGYADILPHITRGEKVNELAALAHPVTVQSWISALLPLSTMKNEHLFATDLSMRNIYFSLTFMLFFLYALVTKKNGLQNFFLIAGSAFLLLSAGGIFKSFAYKYIPLIAYVRLNGEFAIFTLFSFILVAAFSLDDHMKHARPFAGKIRIIYYLLELFFAAYIVYGLYRTFHEHNSFLFQLKNIANEKGFPSRLKALIDGISFSDTLWLQGTIQLLLLWGIKWCLVNNKTRMLLKICITDLVIATLLNIPFTGVGKASVATVQAVLNKSPHGIFAAALQPVSQNDSISLAETGLVGNWSFYNKQIGVKEFAFYPIELNTSRFIFSDPDDTHLHQPYLFIPGDMSKNNITIDHFTGSSIQLSAQNKTGNSIVYQQNFYPHWYYVKDGEKIAAGTYRNIFLAAPLSAGMNKIAFIFDPGLVKKAMMISVLALSIYLLGLLMAVFRSSSPS